MAARASRAGAAAAFLAAIAVMAALCFAAFAGYFVSLRAAFEERNRSAAMTMLTQAADEYEQFASRMHIIADVAQRHFLLATLRNGQPAADRLVTRLADIVEQNPLLLQIIIVDANGAIRAMSDTTPSPGSRAPDDWLTTQTRMRMLGLRAGYSGLTRGESVYAIAAPIEDRGGVVKAAVHLVMSPEVLTRGLHVRTAPGLAVTKISSATGIASGGPQPAPATLDAMRALPMRKPALLEIDDSAYVAGYRTLAFNDAEILGVAIDRAALFEAGFWPRIAPALIGLAVALAILGLLAFVVLRFDRRARRAMTAAENARIWLQTLVEAMPDSVLVIDAGGVIRSVNQATERILGWRETDLVGHGLDLLVPEASRAAHGRMVESFFVARRNHLTMGDFRRVRAMKADGGNIPVMISLGFVENSGQAFAVAIMRDMTAMEQANAHLAELADEVAVQLQIAQEADRAKSHFLERMSHELRTPLNAINGFSSLLARPYGDPPTQDTVRDYARFINEAGDQLLQKIDDILTVAPLEEGRYALTIEPLSAGEIWAPALATTAAFATERGVRVDPPAGDDIRLRGDRRALQQCLVHILSNAIRYTAAGGSAQCATEEREDAVVMTVTDTGRGIAPDAVAELAQPFVKIGDVFTDDSDGTGLGLYIVRKLVEQMGGGLSITSRLNAGTSVAITLPAR